MDAPTTPAPEPEAPADAPTSDWSLLRRLAFRFAFLYLPLYAFPFPLMFLGGEYGVLGWSDGVSTRFGAVMGKLTEWTQAAVLWTGEHVFEVEVFAGPTGSGDTTFAWIRMLLCVAAALAGAGLWSLFGRRRRSHPSLGRLLWIFARYYVGMWLLVYGVIKLWEGQFPDPHLWRYLQPYGESSPMGLVWTLMGQSDAYTVFSGFGEALGGTLLLFRRTATLGAIVSAFVMTNVVMLNFCYDVPVKQFSAHLLLVAALIAAVDARRLIGFFVLNRPAPAADITPRLHRWWGHALRWALKLAVLVPFLFGQVKGARQAVDVYGDGREKPPLYGIWEVERFVVDGEEVPPLLTSDVYWRHFIVERPGQVRVEKANRAREMFVFTPDLEAGTAAVGEISNPHETWAWTLEQPVEGVLELSGSLREQAIEVRMRRRSLDEFLLPSRGFHWISERPYNR